MVDRRDPRERSGHVEVPQDLLGAVVLTSSGMATSLVGGATACTLARLRRARSMARSRVMHDTQVEKPTLEGSKPAALRHTEKNTSCIRSSASVQNFSEFRRLLRQAEGPEPLRPALLPNGHPSVSSDC